MKLCPWVIQPVGGRAGFSLNLSLTPSGSLFAKTGRVAALFEPSGVTGFLTHVYVCSGAEEGLRRREREDSRENSLKYSGWRDTVSVSSEGQ